MLNKVFAMRKKLFIPIILFLLAARAFADTPFAVILYDAKTEKSLGAFPPTREVWARTIDTVREANAKAVVLKFFYDLPKDGDVVLADSMRRIPTFLQACINEKEATGNALDSRFAIKPDKDYRQALSGNGGWLPVAALARNAYALGFVDIRDFEAIPILEKYDGTYVRSLQLCVLQYVFSDLRLEDNCLVRANKKIKLNRYSEMRVAYPEKDELGYLSLCDVLNGSFDAKAIAGKIVIIGWDGNDSGTVSLPTGKVKTHRAFIYGLYDMYEQLR